MGLTLKNLLWNLKLIEFPTIFVVKCEKVTEFRLKFKNDKLKRERHQKLKSGDEKNDENSRNTKEMKSGVEGNADN